MGARNRDDVDAALKKGDLKFRLNGFKLKGSWVLVKTRGYGGAPQQLAADQARDDWAGPIDITEFAPLSVKTPDADLADILAGDTRPLAQQRAGQGRRHRRDVQEDHRARAEMKAPANISHEDREEHEGKDRKSRRPKPPTKTAKPRKRRKPLNS